MAATICPVDGTLIPEGTTGCSVCGEASEFPQPQMFGDFDYRAAPRPTEMELGAAMDALWTAANEQAPKSFADLVAASDASELP